MMILGKIKAWFAALPTLRGREALKAYSILGVGLFLFGGALALAYNFLFLPGLTLNPGATATVSATKAPEEARDIPSPINGVLFTATEAKVWQNRHPLAVIIENHRDARPQSGLSQAEVVYETLAEGGITRYLVMYLTNLEPVTLGPIRSMRPYFLDWLAEYDALAAHVGGNIDALDRIRSEKVKDLDQFSLGTSAYDRVNDRVAPHNVYTNTGRLWAAADKKGYGGASTFKSWPFKEEATASARPSNQVIRLNFLGDARYKVTWTYSQEANTYLRSVGGADDVDRNNNERIAAKTVVIQKVTYQTGTTRIGEKSVTLGTIGSGKATIFTDGVATEANWSKKSRTDRTIFTDSTDKEIPFNRGLIWVEVVPTTSAVEF